MRSAAKLAALGIGLGLAATGCGTGTTVIALVSPTISQVSPQVVTAGTPSVTVTVTGENFQSNASVTVNGSAVPTTMVSATTLSAKISGSPLAQPAVAHLQVKNTNGGSSNQVPLTITSASQPSSLQISTSGLPGAQRGTAYNSTLSASGGTPGYTWSVTSGSLPAGLTLSSAGAISGTPSGNGTSTFAVTVSDSSSPAQTQTVTLSIVVLPATAQPPQLNIASGALGSGQVGSAYTASLSATGGTPGYTWSLASGSLPAGLTLSSSGTISGTPAANGTATFTVSVKDSGSPAQSVSGQVSITVAAATLAVQSVSLGAGTVGSSYTTTLTATGGTPGYTWSLASGSLPAGLTLASSGIISGTPTAAGTATFTVGVKDSGSPVQTASAQESVTIGASGLTITSTSLAAGQNGSSYSTTLSATGGTPGYTWSLASGSLPAGLTLSKSGNISGTPTAAGTSSFTVQVSDSGSPAQTAATSESLTISPSSLTITSTSLAAGQNGSSYSTTLSATGGTPSYTWSLASGSLPAGLTLSKSGNISGTPTAAGTSSFTVQVSDSGSPVQTASTPESLTISASNLAITSTSLGAGTNGSSYSTTLSATGGTPGYTWSLVSGSLPTGLTLSKSGKISGTPTVTGTATFTVGVKDSGSPAQTVSAQETLTIAGSNLAITSTTLAAGTNGSSYSTTLSATGGSPGYTWSVTSGSLPAGLTLSSSGKISGTPTASGTATFTVGVKDSGSPAQTASAQESLTITSNLAITSTSLAAGETGSSYSANLAASGGTPSYSWTISSGSLPAGLTLSSSGVISGTPTASGTVNFTLTVSDSGSPLQTISAQESINVAAGALTITSPNPGTGTIGTGYSVTLSASGGVPAYNWTVSSGSLPAGLTLSNAGVISGTPTTNGTSAFTVSVADNETPTQTASTQESITINNATQSNPPAGEQIYIYPQAPVAPRGSYQTVTAIVTGVSNTTVTWNSDGGTIVGTNPCVVNEPCTIALYSGSTGTYHLTATSNANQQIVATSTITFTPSPTPRMDHPRLLVTSDMIPALQAKATANNPMYQAMMALASQDYTRDSSLWSFSTWNGSGCTGGSGPTSDQSPNYRENDAYWMAQIALFDQDSTTRNQYGCAARDVFMTSIGYVLSGELSLETGNRWADSATAWAFTADLLMGGGYLSAADQVVVRQYLASFAQQQVVSGTGAQAVVGSYNSAAQFDESNVWSTTGMRAMNNNYTQARILILAAAALTFNDNTTDDPALPNTCNATRYQVCPDGTAGSLHAYWSYVTGGLLYKYWADIEDPGVVQQAYDLSSQPSCQTAWGTPVPCLGSGRGGESNEGFFYGGSVTSLRRAVNAIHYAGYDDPLVYGPQMSMGTMSYWDLRYVADLTALTGLSGASGEQSRWNFLTHGDSLYYFAYPSNFGVEAALLSSDAATGRTDRAGALQWLLLNTAYGLADGKTGNCKFYCGFDSELSNDYASNVALDMFLALPAADPVTNNPPSDPRPSLPTDWYDAGNQHLVVRDGWGINTNTIFSTYCTNTQIDHEHEFCGGFDLYSNGEYITKGRMEFNDYNDEMSSSWNKNAMSLMQYPGETSCTSNPWCQYWQSAEDGGQWWHGYQAGLDTLYHSELPGYVAAIVDDHNSYNGGWGVYANFNTVTSASRSLLYLRGSNQVIYYDRGATGSNAWDKATYLVTTGAPTISGNTASWLTRSGNQKVFWTALDPDANSPQLDTTFNDPDAANDWEIYGRIKADAGNVESARFLSVLQWGASTFSGSSASLVSSTAGTSFEGALVGSSLVMFMHDWPGALSSVTYPASGATTHYISDLTPNTAYTITGAGAPSSATTDAAGVLTFSATGTGSITISPASGS